MAFRIVDMRHAKYVLRTALVMKTHSDKQVAAKAREKEALAREYIAAHSEKENKG